MLSPTCYNGISTAWSWCSIPLLLSPLLSPLSSPLSSLLSSLLSSPLSSPISSSLPTLYLSPSLLAVYLALLPGLPLSLMPLLINHKMLLVLLRNSCVSCVRSLASLRNSACALRSPASMRNCCVLLSTMHLYWMIDLVVELYFPSLPASTGMTITHIKSQDFPSSFLLSSLPSYLINHYLLIIYWFVLVQY